MIAEFITCQDPRWRHVLERTPHDVYHLPEYVELCARHEDGEPCAFYAEVGEATFLAPLLIRRLPPSLGLNPANAWLDAVSPYGYSSPLVCSGERDALRHFFQALRELGSERGIVTAFYRLHPLLPHPREPLAQYGELVCHGQTVSVDLAQTGDEMWAQTRRNHKQNIQQLRKAGFRTEIDRWEYLEAFIVAYHQTMERVCASNSSRFEETYFHDLRTTLKDRLHLVVTLSPQGDFTAGGLFMTCNGIVQCHLTSTDTNYLAQAPSKLMIDGARCWARDAGYHDLHLGGGVGCRDDSLFHFKAGFSRRRHDYFTFRMVLDEQKHATLNQIWRALHDETLADTDYFPPYRRRPC